MTALGKIHHMRGNNSAANRGKTPSAETRAAQKARAARDSFCAHWNILTYLTSLEDMLL